MEKEGYTPKDEKALPCLLILALNLRNCSGVKSTKKLADYIWVILNLENCVDQRVQHYNTAVTQYVTC